MTTRGSKIEDGGEPARSVLECGSPHVFTGVRPSSGAETGERHTAQRISSALDHAELAAAEDGRTPLNRSSSTLSLSHPPGDRTRSHSARGLAQSKTWRSLVASLVFLAPAIIAHAQSYSIDWFTIAGGGGTSSGGGYSVSGTIGQPDAGGPMTGGLFAVTGGFWALPFAVQIPGRPTLIIIPFGQGQARISWVPNTPGFVLQETLSLSPANWINSPSGAANPVIVTANLPTKFYRLRKP